jgi:hypothetical protein
MEERKKKGEKKGKKSWRKVIMAGTWSSTTPSP